jgi:hypothetical protein
MNNTISIFEEVSALVASNSLYNKSLETSIDKTIFNQLENCLSKLIIKDENLFLLNIDYLSPLLLFLLEHIPLEIDFNFLTSTKKIYKPNLFSLIQYSYESQKLLNQLFNYLQINNLEEFLLLKQNQQSIYHHCLHYLTPLLLKTTYDKYPLALQVFVHIIKSLSQSSLSEIIDIIFPICLITLDDPSIDIKLISLYLLDHLQKNLTTTDLLLFNRANVIM